METAERIFLTGILLNLFVFSAMVVHAQQLNYTNIIKHIDELEKAGEYKKAYKYLMIYKNCFPEYFFPLSKEEINLNEKLSRYKENLEIFSLGHSKGCFYFVHPGIPRFKPYRQLKGFADISKKDLSLRDSALAVSKTSFEITLPHSYVTSKSWPVCFIFHGGGSNLQKVKEHWHSEKFNSGFVKVYLQSYRHYDSETFGWRSGDNKADKEINKIYKEITGIYPIDETKVLVMGISAGGTYAIDIAIRQVIPISGFLAVCPGIPNILDKEKFHTISKRNIKGYIIGGANDHYLPKQQQMVKMFDEIKLPYTYEIIKNMGHQYPENEDKYIDMAIQFLLSSNN